MRGVLCSRCGLAPIQTGGLCSACDQYRHRTGRDRPPGVIVKHAGRLLDRHDQARAPDTVPVDSGAERLRRRAEEATRERAERLRRDTG